MMEARPIPDSPYKGLTPYTEQDSQFFFGRDEEREIIIDNLMASRLTVLCGTSGVGKSSILRAGVTYHLRQLAVENQATSSNPRFAVILMNSWHDDPVIRLKEMAREEVEASNGQSFASPPQADSLSRFLHELTQRAGTSLFIILDQFEEYFLYHPQERGPGTFADEFQRAVNNANLPAHFLISVREDALAKLEHFKAYIPKVFGNHLAIHHLNRDAARLAINKPIEQYNSLQSSDQQRVKIESDLVEVVLDQVKRGSIVLGETGRGIIDTPLTETQIETPYLQLVMTRLWDEEMRASSRTLRRATLDGLKGAKGIVRTHLDTTMSGLAEHERRIAADMFHHLVTPTGSKILHSATDLSHYAELKREQVVPVLEKLSGSNFRILRSVAALDAQQDLRYEIFHDVLARAVLDWRSRYAEKIRIAKTQRRWIIRLGIAIVFLLLSLAAIASILFAGYKGRRAEEANQLRQKADERRVEAENAKAEADYIQRRSAEAANLNSQLLKVAYEDQLSALIPLEILLEYQKQKNNPIGQLVVLNNIAGIYRNVAFSSQLQQNHQQAEEYFREALTYYQSALNQLEVIGRDYPSAAVTLPDAATTYNDMAMVYIYQGKYGEAQPLFEKAAQILANVTTEEDFEWMAVSKAQVDDNLAECYRRQGKYSEAERLYKLGLETREKFLPRGDNQTAQSHLNLAILYSEQGRFDEAEPHFMMAQEIWQKDSVYADSLASINYYRGDMYRRQRKYADAVRYLTLALDHHDNPQSASSLLAGYDRRKLGLVYLDQENFREAERYLNQARNTLEKGLGLQHPDLAVVRSNLASLYFKQNKYAAAEQLFKEALEVQERDLPDHPDLAVTLANYADLLRRMGRAEEATEYEKRAETIRTKPR
jgi:tetratricopeptide (TPR) repeat protein